MKNSRFKIPILSTALFSLFFLIPIFAFAEVAGGPEGFMYFVVILLSIINFATLVVIALSLVAFLWGLANFIRNADNDEEVKKGKKLMIWGLVALFVMFSIWGIINLLDDTFGFGLYPFLPESGTPNAVVE